MSQKNEGNQQYKELKTAVSDTLVGIQGFFSNDEVARILRIDKDIINKHIQRKSIPPEYFEKYVKAWRKTTRKPRKPTVVEQNKAEKWNELYKCLMAKAEITLYLWNCFNNSFVVPSLLNDKNALDGKSARFPYLVDKCFNAFTTLTADDVAFLCHFFRGDTSKRETILQKMDEAEVIGPNHLISILTSKEGQNWTQAHKLYSAEIKRNESAQNGWIHCAEHIQLWIKNNSFIKAHETRKPYNVLSVLQFLELIWPEEGEADTKFGPKEIEAIIVFKYFLTQEAQQKLLSDLQIEYT